MANVDATLYEWLMHFYNFGSACRQYSHAKCWGATILRVSYDDDELFARAVRAIRRLMLVAISIEYTTWLKNYPPEPLPAEWDFSAICSSPDASRLAARYRAMVCQDADASPPGHQVTLADVVAAELRLMHHNIVVKDRAALDGADPAAAWLYHNEHAKEFESSPRGGFFVYLDEESIELLAQVPEDAALAAMTRDEQTVLAWENWVKVVSMDGHVDPDDLSVGPVETGISEDLWRRRRIRLGNWFQFLIEHAERYMEGVSHEAKGHERWPGSAEWTFGPKDGLLFPGKKERMEALYGPQEDAGGCKCYWRCLPA